ANLGAHILLPGAHRPAECGQGSRQGAPRNPGAAPGCALHEVAVPMRAGVASIAAEPRRNAQTAGGFRLYRAARPPHDGPGDTIDPMDLPRLRFDNAL